MSNKTSKSLILIIDDDRDFSETLQDIFVMAGLDVIISDNGNEGLLRCRSAQPNLVILDLNLPDIDGADVIRALRVFSKVPLVVLSGRESPVDKILALEIGADDYVSKPFENMELLARIKAILRREHWYHEAGVSVQTEAIEDLELAFPWKVDFESLCIRSLQDDSEVALTGRETKILKLFALKKGKIVEKTELLASIGYPRDHDNGPVEVCLSRLKKKFLEQNIPYPIQAIRGLGYKISIP